MKFKKKLILHLLTLIIFGVNIFIVFYNPSIIKENPDLTGRNFGLIVSGIFYIVLSLLWYNQDFSVKLGLMFKVKNASVNDASDWYLFWERVGLFLALMFSVFAMFVFL